MAKVTESANTTQIKSDLEAGLKSLSGDQVVTFNRYTRAVLPLDGYVFWVRDLATESIQVSGSIHYSTYQQQNDDETIGLNKVIFTTSTLITEFNNVSTNAMWIGSKDSIRFGFTSRDGVYDNAGLYHYRGDAIYPAMFTQIIDNPAAPVDLGGLIASNSLPLWLELNQYAPVYPAMLLPSNLPPPYIVADISSTRALQSMPDISPNSTSKQLLTERVKLTIYGLRNDAAIDFHNYILTNSLNYDKFGILNMSVVADEKRGQSELGILAQKKSVEYEISYYQYRSQNVARQLVLSAIPSIILTN